MDSPRVLVTGASRGLGEAIAKAFHEAGAALGLASRTDSGLAARLGRNARYIQCDVRSPASIWSAVEAMVAFADGVDVLVNNAGISAWRRLQEIDESFFDEMVATNLKSTLFCCQAAAAVMRAGGCVVNISSLAGKRGSANNAAYCAAKFGVNGLTQALAKELGPRGIRVNAICPVYLITPGLKEALREACAPAAGKNIDGYLSEFAATQTALGRLPQVQEVSAACLFLASPAASAITGQCINVDCGVLPQ